MNVKFAIQLIVNRDKIEKCEREWLLFIRKLDGKPGRGLGKWWKKKDLCTTESLITENCEDEGAERNFKSIRVELDEIVVSIFLFQRRRVSE